MKEQPHLVGIDGATRSAIALQLSLVELDEVPGLAAGALERVVDMFGAAPLERGDDEADIEPHCAGLDRCDDTPARVAPAFGRIVRSRHSGAAPAARGWHGRRRPHRRRR